MMVQLSIPMKWPLLISSGQMKWNMFTNQRLHSTNHDLNKFQAALDAEIQCETIISHRKIETKDFSLNCLDFKLTKENQHIYFSFEKRFGVQ